LDAKRAVLVILTCIILGISQIVPVLGSVQGAEGISSTSPNEQLVNDQVASTFKIDETEILDTQNIASAIIPEKQYHSISL